MPSILYIIGNGFDLYHGLDTSYQSFGFYLKNNYREIYNDFVKYFDLNYLNSDDPNSIYDPLWANFEIALSSIDVEEILEDNKNYLASTSRADFQSRDWHSYQIQMELIVDKLTKEMAMAFKKFILNVKFPSNIDDNSISIDQDSKFLNFNYTDTLERYYDIQRHDLLYIHNKATDSDTAPILGHGVDPKEFEKSEVKSKPPKGSTKEQLEQWMEEMSDQYDYSYETGEDELYNYYQRSFKQTDEIINQHSQFFDELKEIKKVIILGHSLSDVDINRNHALEKE